jgi:hypothetical protein
MKFVTVLPAQAFSQERSGTVMMTVTELLGRAKHAIESGENSLHAAAEDIAAAQEQGATQRQIAEAVGKSAAWVNRLLQWRESGYHDGTAFGPQAKASRQRARCLQATEQNKKTPRPRVSRRWLLQHALVPRRPRLKQPEPKRMRKRRKRRLPRPKLTPRRRRLRKKQKRIAFSGARSAAIERSRRFTAAPVHSSSNISGCSARIRQVSGQRLRFFARSNASNSA